MAEKLFVLPEIIAMLQAENVPDAVIEKVKQRAEFVHEKRKLTTAGEDNVFEVGSGYSHSKNRGHVRLRAGRTEHQLEPKKAQEIGLWLVHAAEAAISDTMVMTWLRDKVGLDDPAKIGELLLQLREIRQGSRETVFHQ